MSYSSDELTFPVVLKLFGVTHLFNKEFDLVTDSFHMSLKLTKELFKHVMTEAI